MFNLLLFFMTAAFWGGSFIAIKYAISTTFPIYAALWRVIIGLIFLLLILKITKRSIKIPLRHIWKVWITGILAIGLPFALLFWGEQNISAGLAGIINSTVPLWTFLFGLLFLKNFESYSLKNFIGLTLGLCGVACIFYKSISFIGHATDIFYGAISVLLMAVSYGVAAVINRRILSGNDKIEVHINVFHQMLSSVIFLFVLTIVIIGWRNLALNNISISFAASSIYLGIFSTGIAWLAFYRLIKVWGAVKATSITYIVPIMAVIFDFIFFRQLPNFLELLGMLTIFISIAFIQLPSKASKV